MNMKKNIVSTLKYKFSFCGFPYVDPLSIFAKFVLFYHYNRFVAICGQSINEGYGYRNKYDKRNQTRGEGRISFTILLLLL